MNNLLSKIQKRDINILMMFNISIKCKILDILMPILTYIGSTKFCVFTCIITVLYSKTRTLGICFTTALIVSSIFTRIIKVNVNRLRPYLKLENLNINKIDIDKYSFPSGHTTCAFCLGITFSLFIPSLSIVFVLLASLVGISRMYLGVHYPTDIMVGMFIGTFTSFMTYYILSNFAFMLY